MNTILTIATQSVWPLNQVAIISNSYDEKLSSGFLSFLVTFILALTTILIVKSMMKRIRKQKYILTNNNKKDK